MELLGFLKSFSDFIERKMLVLIGFWIVVFAIYRILKHSGFFGSVSWLGPPSTFAPDPVNTIIFSLSATLFILAYMFSFRLAERKRLLLIFFATFILVAGFTQFSRIEWSDAQGYYDLAVLGAKEGQIHLIWNYHTLHEEWSPEVKNYIESELKKLGILEWGAERLDIDGETDNFSGRTVKHPPLWPLILSFFILAFGDNSFSPLVAEAFIVSLIPLILYFLVKRYSNETVAIKVSFLFVAIPAFMLSSAEPVLDPLVVLFTVTSAYFFLSGIDKGNRKSILIAGVLAVLAFYTKFTALFVFVVFLVIILSQKGLKKGLAAYAIFLIPFAIITAIFMLANYYFFLTMITVRALLTFFLSGEAEFFGFNPFLDLVLRLNYLNYAFPVVLFVISYFLRNIRPLKVLKKPAMLFVIAYFLVLLFYPARPGIDRQMLPFLFLTSIPVAMGFKRMDIKNSQVVLLIIVSLVTTVLLLL